MFNNNNIFYFILILFILNVLAKYPNEIIDTPIVNCEPDSISIKIRTSSSNPSHIYAEDFHDTSKCMIRNQNKINFIHGECGMTTEHIDNPLGTMYRICLSVQIHPLFVTDSDRSYCAQCVYMENNLVDDLERNIAISEMTPNELDPQFDEASNPHCSYSIRKGTIDGPEVHAAVVGETVFHVWQCNNENIGILVQNCHVEDLQGDKILIIDQNGCGVDQYLFKTPQYSNDLHTAFLQSSVFKFVDKSMTRFRCQLRLCVKNRGKGCSSTTPPSTCPNIDDSDIPLAPGTGPSSPSPQSSSGTSSAEAVLGIGSPPSLSPTVEQILQRPSIFSSLPSERTEKVGEGGGGGGGGGESKTIITTTTTQKTLNNISLDQPIGPPSIRPYGPGRSLNNNGIQIISGKTEQPIINPYRKKRSFSLSSFQIINGIGKYLNNNNYRNKRSTTTKIKENEIQQQLDVVGLIRVLDNADDIKYFVNQNQTKNSFPFSSSSSPSFEQINNNLELTTINSKKQQKFSFLNNNYIIDSDLLLNNNKQKIETNKKRRIYSSIERNEFLNNNKLLSIELKQKKEKLEICLSNKTFWLIIILFISLLFIQFIIITLLAIDHYFKLFKYLFK
ncbi:ZP domain-containing protein [Meloidogyne graminicola]|uniref:ZP domain-containing protein n=1 Tax=Meloidogyne graminicola TaxID=189291 RepID=A0A8T0A4U3_9BILA|nr:ZP domain-containing protein [Meloidogyne graminicola]